MHFFTIRLTTQLPLLLLVGASTAMILPAAEPVVVVDVQRGDAATAEYRFESVPAPSASDAGNRAQSRLLQGSVDPNGASLEAVFDGQTARQQDDPRHNSRNTVPHWYRNSTQPCERGAIRSSYGPSTPARCPSSYGPRLSPSLRSSGADVLVGCVEPALGRCTLAPKLR